MAASSIIKWWRRRQRARLALGATIQDLCREADEELLLKKQDGVHRHANRHLSLLLVLIRFMTSTNITATQDGVH